MLLLLRNSYPDAIKTRYKLDVDISELQGYEMLELIGRKRGMLISGGEIDTLRAAETVLDEFRGGILGKITLDRTEDYGAFRI